MPPAKFKGLVFENNRPTEASLKAYHRDYKERMEAHLPITRGISAARREAAARARREAREAKIEKICSPRKTRAQRQALYPRGQPTNEEARLMAERGGRSLSHLINTGQLIAPMDIPISPKMERQYPEAVAKARVQAEARAVMARIKASRAGLPVPRVKKTPVVPARTPKKPALTYSSTVPSGNRLYAGPAKIGKTPTISPSHKKTAHSKSVSFDPSVMSDVSQRTRRYIRQVRQLQDEMEDDDTFDKVYDLLEKVDDELQLIEEAEQGDESDESDEYENDFGAHMFN